MRMKTKCDVECEQRVGVRECVSLDCQPQTKTFMLCITLLKLQPEQLVCVLDPHPDMSQTLCLQTAARFEWLSPVEIIKV